MCVYNIKEGYRDRERIIIKKLFYLMNLNNMQKIRNIDLSRHTHRHIQIYLFYQINN